MLAVHVGADTAPIDQIRKTIITEASFVTIQQVTAKTVHSDLQDELDLSLRPGIRCGR